MIGGVGGEARRGPAHCWGPDCLVGGEQTRGHLFHARRDRCGRCDARGKKEGGKKGFKPLTWLNKVGGHGVMTEVCE
jgi:hypothetical protein